jgi:dynein heavy chain
VQDNLDESYIEQPPFDIFQTYTEMTPSTPIFFVLFPGVDPTPEVEKAGAKLGKSIAAGNFLNISMG